MKIGYQLYKNEDMDEGLGKPVAIPGIFLDLNTAENAAAGRGPYGSFATIREVTLFETVGEFVSWEQNQDPEFQEYLRLHQKFSGRIS